MKVQNLIIHCSATPDGRDVRGKDIIKWHTDPKPKGNGWSRPGYNIFVGLDGKREILVPFDNDGIVEWNEIANGAKGFNDVSYHVCYAGGMDASGKVPIDTRTRRQKIELENIVREVLFRFPWIKIGGHEQLNKQKACPSFNVPTWLRSLGIEEKNILKA